MGNSSTYIFLYRDAQETGKLACQVKLEGKPFFFLISNLYFENAKMFSMTLFEF